MNNEKIYIKELSKFLNKEVISDFLVVQKELREGAKNFYIRLKLADKTGSMSANVWNQAKMISEMFQEGDVIRIKGIVISYKAQLQLTVNKVRLLQEEEYDLANFMETTSQDMNKLSDCLFGFIDSINDTQIKQLLLNIFEDKEFYAKFGRAPAAKSWHHNYLGGLLEHTVSVATICDFTANMYPVNRDILMAGAIFHDIGKVFEYDVTSKIEFSTIGRLVGHLALSDQFVCEKAALINNFSANNLLKIRHLILAHHGEYEKASVRLPQTIEAILLHYADNMDAQTIGVKQLIEAAQNPDQEWSEFDRLNQRYYYLK
ncbi:MAG: HD domain-containing protein [Candidatus Cloacimonetes bacterium]|nr:HD domain-containing protein [Candidatus Cloacimonadota bacterium]